MISVVIESLLSLFLLMLIGYIAGKTNIITPKLSEGLSRVLLQIALPCTILMSMQKEFSVELLVDGGIAVGISILIYIASWAIGILLCMLLRIKNPQAGIWTFSAIFPNVGYMGFPVIRAVLGDGALFFVTMNNIIFNILSTTIGIRIIRKSVDSCNTELAAVQNKKDVNMPIIATVLGIILFLFSITIPAPVAAAFVMGGNMMTPLSMIIVGTLLAKSNLKRVFVGLKEYFLIITRLLLMPAILFFCIDPFVKNDLLLKTLVFLTAMPVSAVTAIYSVRFKSDSFLGSRLVVISSVLSILTLPAIALLF